MGAACVAAACSGVDDARPPLAPGCTTDCGVPPSGGPGGGGETGTGGTGIGEGGTAATTELTGTVVLLSDGTFADPATFKGNATVIVESPTKAAGVSGTFDGTSFTVTGALSDQQAWVAVRPDDTANFIDTFSYPDTTQSTIDPSIVSRALLEEVAFSLASPTEIDTNTAQIVVRVFQANGVGVSGVTANTTAGTFVAYSSSGTFSDTETATDGGGVIVIGNVPTTAFPGRDFVLNLGGAAQGQATVRIARGFVTLVNVVVVP